MKKRINIMFFGICFLAALLGEAYCVEILKGDLFSTIGIGIVVLITGYLFMDSIISTIKQNMEDIKFYTDRTIREEDEKWNERFTEIINFQKATYTATKKNAILLTQQMKEVMSLLEDMEGNNIKELQRVTELQKISMEGQKNALKMEVQYNRENTKKLLGALKEYESKSDLENQLAKIIDLLETNNELMKTRITSVGVTSPDTGNINWAEENASVTGEPEPEAVDIHNENPETEAAEVLNEETKIKAAEVLKEEPEIEAAEILNDESELNVAENDIKEMEQEEVTVIPEDEAVASTTEVPEESNTTNVTPLYDDPNKALTPDEIAALFASVGR